jgi:ectoine hydroxylase-related dioxygenase (phytanoyl-CoA dioxygenase family)
MDKAADLITPELRATYERDGAVLIKGAYGNDWIEMLRQGHARVRDNPSSPVRVQRSDDGGGLTLTAQFCFRNEPEMHKFTYDSSIAAVAAKLMGSKSATIIFDQMYSKTAGTVLPTFWHHDATVSPFKGRQRCILWLSLDHVPKKYSLEMVRGSHLWGVPFEMHRPEYDDQNKGVVYHKVPPIAENRDSFDIISWEVEPGDIVALNMATLHAAQGGDQVKDQRRAYSTRWAGDDAYYTNDFVRYFHTEEYPGFREGQKVAELDLPHLWPR